MTLAERIFWFKYDNCDIAKDQLPQIKAQLGTLDFLNETVGYLADIISGCQRSLKQLGDPKDLEGFDQILYADHIELHNKAVDLLNDLMDRGIDINA